MGRALYYASVMIRPYDREITNGRENDALSLRNGYVSLEQEPQSLLQILKLHTSISISIE